MNSKDTKSRDIEALLPGEAGFPGLPHRHSHLTITLAGEQPRLTEEGDPKGPVGRVFPASAGHGPLPLSQPWFRGHMTQVWLISAVSPSRSDWFKDAHVTKTMSVRILFGTFAGPQGKDALFACGLELLAAT